MVSIRGGGSELALIGGGNICVIRFKNDIISGTRGKNRWRTFVGRIRQQSSTGTVGSTLALICNTR